MLLDAPELCDVVHQAVMAAQPHVIVAYCTGLAHLASDPSLTDIPVVLDMVDVDSEKWRILSGRTAGPMRWIYAREARHLRRFEIEMMARARCTLVVAERERATLREMAPNACIRVMSNGVDLARFFPQAPPAVNRDVVFCGVMNYAPNEDAAMRLAARVWPLIRAACHDARLLLVGAYPTNRIRDLAAHDSSIVVTGSVPEVQPYLWSSAVSAAPIAVARGLQNKVLEALAAGLPVVTTTAVADGLPHSVRPGCIVRDSDEEFAEAVIALLRTTPAARRDLASRADLTALSWDEQLSSLMPVLTDAAAAPGSF
jgi:glycosyltransferase involved in cell wall biosynthesis